MQSRSGAYRGKPVPTEYDEFNLPRLHVVPTSEDAASVVSDETCASPEECAARMRRRAPMDAGLTGEERFQKAAFNISSSEDSFEMSVECFGAACEGGAWPERTDLRCWWCLHPFETRPFPCPLSYKAKRGAYRVRGVFCGPSCAKSWACTSNSRVVVRPTETCHLIDRLARSRGFAGPGSGRDAPVHIPLAPPRECLCTFSGREGMSIEQFRGLCARGFEVEVYSPPLITDKLVIVAQCNTLKRAASMPVEVLRAYKKKKAAPAPGTEAVPSMVQKIVCHVESPEMLALPAVEFAKLKREGMEIFAGVGVRRLTDFFDTTKAGSDKRQKQKSSSGGGGGNSQSAPPPPNNDKDSKKKKRL
jgi:hypothetical protein